MLENYLPIWKRKASASVEVLEALKIGMVLGVWEGGSSAPDRMQIEVTFAVSQVVEPFLGLSLQGAVFAQTYLRQTGITGQVYWTSLPSLFEEWGLVFEASLLARHVT